jgi:hypothetical protein
MRFVIALPVAAADALRELASGERRDPRDEASVIIIDALRRRRLVTGDGLERIPTHRPADTSRVGGAA